MQEVFEEAVRAGDAPTVRALLADPRVDPAASDNHAIGEAAIMGHAKVVRALLAEPRVDPAARNNYTIRVASGFGYAEVVRMLLTDPRVDPRGAIQHSTSECARIIASDGTHGGMEQNFNLFQKYHPDILREYQCYAIAWVARQEYSWIDVVEPVVKR